MWWIDDVLVPTKSFDEANVTLAPVFEESETFQHELSPHKIDLFEKEITLCGRKISDRHSKLDTESIQNLRMQRFLTSFYFETTGFDQYT